ncbi:MULTISPECIES: phosphoserine phosphatase SerB [unclassified Novosphingobium]|uniref:phosphoserine phosphatase SerB n=1 Tax=unclassified Novosphingobium TaxID=2644732 RepID=UPI0025F26370|nr:MULTISPECIES: phosphoserine phosphatase SerB [unclassified Novosphingobium]HQV04838.1 phosphoserine phosphatase SerB [Novosphingobium sp.]
MLIARVIAEPAVLSAHLDAAVHAIEAQGAKVLGADSLPGLDTVLQFMAQDADPVAVRGVIDRHFSSSDHLIVDHLPQVPGVFVSDMDSTMIGQECIDELGDFAGIKDQIAAITERAMQGELDFAEALGERVRLLGGLGEDAIQQCLDQRITDMPGARTLVATLKAHGCETVLVTGGFHQFADPVGERLGFERVVGNRLAVSHGKLTGGLIGDIVDSAVKEAVLRGAVEARGGAASLATGDGANDIPMLVAASYGLAYHAKPKARAAANGAIDRGDLTDVLRLLGIPEGEWA